MSTQPGEGQPSKWESAMSSGITLLIAYITLVGLIASLIVFELIDQRHGK